VFHCIRRLRDNSRHNFRDHYGCLHMETIRELGRMIGDPSQIPAERYHTPHPTLRSVASHIVKLGDDAAGISAWRSATSAPAAQSRYLFGFATRVVLGVVRIVAASIR
jgi:hypothetical protein